MIGPIIDYLPSEFSNLLLHPYVCMGIFIHLHPEWAQQIRMLRLGTADVVKFSDGSTVLESDDTVVLIYFHGGGYSLLNPIAYAPLCVKLVEEFNTIYPSRKLIVYSVDYPLATTSPYPAQLNAAFSLYSHLTNHLYLDSKRIFIAGDSAGGHLSLSLALRIKESKLPEPKGLILVSPWLDINAKTQNKTPFDYINSHNLKKFTKAFLPPTFVDCTYFSFAPNA